MASIISLLFVIGLVFLIIKAIKGSLGADGKISATGSMICPTCGTRGEPKTITKGSIIIEIILWICFLIPGLIYSVWRLTTKQKGCPSCGAAGMIGINTPMGQNLIKNLNA